MKRLDEQQQKSLAHLLNTSEFQHIIRWVEESLKEADIANRTLTGEALSQSQGTAQALSDIMRRVSDSRPRNP